MTIRCKLPCFRIDAHQLAGNSLQATGCQWRALPKDYPPWKQVCNTFARWRQRGVWDVLLAVMVHSAGIQDRVEVKALLIRLFMHFAGLWRGLLPG